MCSTVYEPVTIRSFSFNDDELLQQAYRRLKYRVFVEDLGWNSLVDEPNAGIAKVDYFDAEGLFLLAISDGLPIGVIRAIALKDGFPHRELFEQHLHHPRFSAMLHGICMLNALAVLPLYRGKTFCTAEHNWEGSVAKLLVLGIMRCMEEQNQKAAIATAQGPVVYFFQKLGFQVIDRPAVTHLHPDVFTNVGLVFGTTAHKKALQACKMAISEAPKIDEDGRDLSGYFEECQKNALGLAPLETFLRQR
jgi:hypothetical protein